jgi:hypothetical protein
MAPAGTCESRQPGPLSIYSDVGSRCWRPGLRGCSPRRNRARPPPRCGCRWSRPRHARRQYPPRAIRPTTRCCPGPTGSDSPGHRAPLGRPRCYRLPRMRRSGWRAGPRRTDGRGSGKSMDSTGRARQPPAAHYLANIETIPLFVYGFEAVPGGRGERSQGQMVP